MRKTLTLICGPAIVFFILATIWSAYRFSIDLNPIWFLTIISAPIFAIFIIVLIGIAPNE